jgi:pimeloyl-ACP methyl ester carboxylesterase
MKHLLLALCCLTPQETGTERRPFELVETTLPGTDVIVFEGTYDVYEDREAGEGRVIGLHVVVLPATGPAPKADPVVLLAGGPGQAATTFAGRAAGSWMRAERDILMVDQRGTGRSNPLFCPRSDEEENPQAYLEPGFDPDRMRACLEALRERADLTLYSTPIAADDLAEVCATLGYERVNLIGGSYGTRAALITMQRHPEMIRTAILKGVAPTGLKNPLFHARGAQDALEGVFRTCAEDPACQAAFPNLRADFAETLERLEEAPAEVTLQDGTGEELTLRMSRDAFAEALRVMLYYSNSARRVPLLLDRAHDGDFKSFVQQSYSSNRGIRDILAFGMLLCVTCPEDVARITDDEVLEATAGTFLGDRRVRNQRAICSYWPLAELPADYTDPVTCPAPTLVVSGLFDPVTPPRFGAEAARHLPNAVHVVVPRAHDLGGSCIDDLVRQVIESGSTKGLDTSCVEKLEPIRFELP